MKKFEAQLQVNLLGKLLGKGLIYINDNLIYVTQKKKIIATYSISKCSRFAIFEKSFFGGALIFENESRTIRLNHIKNKDAVKFIDTLNKNIASRIKSWILNSHNILINNIYKQYPRDSRIDLLTNLCKSVSDEYKTQKLFWEKYLDADCMQKVQEIICFHPVDLIAIRNQHEELLLSDRKSFFDKIEANPLTHEQRLSVLRSNDKNMVLAAAGTGKTSVIVAKTLDLIDRKLAVPSEVLVLAYNRDAADELKKRLTESARKCNIQLDAQSQISTFHALGRKIISDAGDSTYLSVFAEDDAKLKQWITRWIEKYILADVSRVFDLIDLSTQPINPLEFTTKESYENYIRDNEFRTLNNELVRGYQELMIANFLFTNQIPYKYEAQYVSKRRIDVGYDYKPDFHLEGTTIYIEHFGINRQGGTRPGIDAFEYREKMVSKRALHAEHGTQLIETFHYEWCEKTLLPGLKQKLASHRINCKPMPAKDIFEKLKEEGRIASWSELLKKALQAIRVERLTKSTIHSRLDKAKIYQPEKYTALLDDLHQGYINELNTQNAIDFDDMIIKTIQAILSGQFIPKWKYILVDEFQDISAARMEFINALIAKGPDPSLTVVGDDWQSIYRFSGGKLELTTRFGTMVGQYTETKLQKTFRYNNSIAKTAGQFIMENPEQYKKYIDTHTKVNQSQVYLLDDRAEGHNGLYQRVQEVIRKIRKHDSDGKIAIIARYNYLLKEAKSELVIAKLFDKDKIYFWSYHRSKGLEANYCILIGFFQGKSGFPNENKNDAVIEALLPSLDTFPHSEERRLLYVGLTRAKQKTYIIADPTAPSAFVIELLAPKYELQIASKAFQMQHRKIFKCPNCTDGYLRLINGKHGEFYACSSGLGCTVGKARVCAKCGAPSIDTRTESICNNASCNNKMRICEKCGRPMKPREGIFGKFWGCTGYGIPDDQCKNTSKV
jgi:DNA helicase IV